MMLYTENLYFSVDYIESLALEKRKHLEEIFNNTWIKNDFINLNQENFIFEELNADSRLIIN
jgi:hypothetical protein